jgi:hypothetical protein
MSVEGKKVNAQVGGADRHSRLSRVQHSHILHLDSPTRHV